MTAFTGEDLAAWAERKRVLSHLTDGRADPAKCTCAGKNCLAAQAVADYFRSCEGGDR